MSLQRIIIFIGVILIGPIGFSQEIEIRNHKTGTPVENVALYNRSKTASALSDKNGKADISGFSGRDSIYFQHPSYEPLVTTKSELLKQSQTIQLSERSILMDEFVISAFKKKEKKENLPFMIEVLEPEMIAQSSYQTAADILLETGSVFVQKSQGGGGSPVLRGFEANKVLLVIDGVRMNNAIYRSGHLQNSITIDNSILDRIEVLFGPSSIMYGSDALGGVIHYYTRSPEFSAFRVNTYAQYASANKSKVIHADMNIGKKKVADLLSITYHDFGDIRTGKNRKSNFGDWGLTNHYVKQVNGTDSTFLNPDPEIQRNSGYQQLDLLNKIRLQPSENIEFVLNTQFSTSSDIDRYDQLNNYDGNDLEYAEWYYGPQNRFLAALVTHYKQGNSLFTDLTATIAWQRIDEDRISRRFRTDERLVQEEDISVYQINLDLFKLIATDHRFHYGFDFSYNDIQSGAFYSNIVNGVRQAAQTRYPDGGSNTQSFSAYGNYKWNISRKFILNGGARYNYEFLESAFDDPFLSFDEIKINNGALTGSASLVYHPSETWQLNAIASTGFRNPNVDDYGKVRAKNEFITVPNDQIKPEYTYNIELGISKTFPGLLRLNAVAYNTWLTNAIVRQEFGLNGADSLLYDGKYYTIITQSNASQALIQGISVTLSDDMQNAFSFRSTLNLTRGEDVTNNEPLAHIPPVYGRTSVSCDHKKITGTLSVVYCGLKKPDQMSPFGEDNEVEMLVGEGFPSWTIINIGSAYQLTSQLRIQVSLENMLDTFYKPFASGIAGPGRNFIFTLRATI
ncbi:MAG: TonB-dependent receptor [Bacteroidales bacterium]|nr:TonB-dependent receptor [Bacteroidales bacterium]